MAKQSIGVGSSANDGTGDPLRTAFQKINANFDELYGVSGILKANGSNAVSAAVAGTDYLAPGVTTQTITGQLLMPNADGSTDNSVMTRRLVSGRINWDFPGISTLYPALLKQVDNFNTGAANDWGTLRWLGRTVGTGSISLITGSRITVGGRLLLSTGATSGGIAGIETRELSSSSMAARTAFNFIFMTPLTGLATSGADDCYMRVGLKAQTARTNYIMVESDSANAPHSWRVKFNPSSGGAFQSVDTGALVTAHNRSSDFHVFSISLIAPTILERVFLGTASRWRVIIVDITATQAFRVFDQELTLSGALLNPVVFADVENKTNAARQMHMLAATIWQLAGEVTY